jgi:hypothetical protein
MSSFVIARFAVNHSKQEKASGAQGVEENISVIPVLMKFMASMYVLIAYRSQVKTVSSAENTVSTSVFPVAEKLASNTHSICASYNREVNNECFFVPDALVLFVIAVSNSASFQARRLAPDAALH